MTSKERQRKTHSVYVIELDPAVLDLKKFMTKNPLYKKGKEAFYVGMTGLDPEKRFQNHQKGYKANRYAKKFGLRLRPDIYAKYNPMSWKDAEAFEVELAESLRRQGYAVWQ